MLAIKLGVLLFWSTPVISTVIAIVSDNKHLELVGVLTAVLTVVIGCFMTAFLIHLSNHPSKDVVTETTCAARVESFQKELNVVKEMIRDYAAKVSQES